MAKLKLDFSKLPPYVKVIISFIPAFIIVVVAILLFILPTNKEIKAIEEDIDVQEKEIMKSQSKAEKLPELIAINENLKIKLNELKKQLPEEKEISSLLKKVSDFAIKSGLKIKLWRPVKKKTHSSGIVYEIPVKVELLGSYHNLGYFFSSLTKLNRIVNISDIKLTNPQMERGYAVLRITFTATTFSAIPEDEISKQPPTGMRGRRA